ncbi:MAG: AAA family ATPase [Deltaproteobacteria bacterium]|nr:AAA family ATPase [Deltaproteobacteria bacterium]MBW2329909.1 AAA family ATPase [Deltaproteobacteria bacterium]
MLTAIRVGNFKAFAEPQRTPIRPLTLIYGANSSGKSSIIHSIVLARHALESGELDVHRTNVGGEAVDLGGFRQYVHRREASRRMEWSAEVDTTLFKGRLAELLAPVGRITVSVAVGMSLDDQDRPLPDASPEIHTYEIYADGESLLRLSRRREGRLHLDRLDYEHPVFRKILKAIVETSTFVTSIRAEDFEELAIAVDSLVPGILSKPGKLFPEGVSYVEKETDTEQEETGRPIQGSRSQSLTGAVRLFFPRVLNEVIQGIGEAVRGEILHLQYLGPLRSYPPRHLAFSQHHDPNWFAGGGYAWDVVRRDGRVRSLVNDWLSSPDRLQTPYELMLRDLVGIDQLEGPMLDGLEVMSEEGLDIEYEEETEYTSAGAWPVIKDPEAEATKLQNLIRSSDIEKLNELILIDRRSNTVVSHRDVGIGVSQVLPVLVGAYAAKNQLIAIEQPEIHLHPALQADLGDVFLESALGEQQNRFLIETHSEHILLRIMRRMRQTFEKSLPENAAAVNPDDVMVLFVEPDGSRSIVREMPLNERGELVKAWPGGFFEEGLREVF